MARTVTSVRHKESPDMGAAIAGQLRGLVARATEGDLEAVEQLRNLESLVPVLLGHAVAGAREHAGYSWAELAPALGTTRQSASERFRAVAPLPTMWTRCGRASFTHAGVYLHERRCQSCTSLAALAHDLLQLQLDTVTEAR